jgi:hypothetical protein
MFHNWLSTVGGRAVLAAGLLLATNRLVMAQSDTAARVNALTAAVRVSADV